MISVIIPTYNEGLVIRKTISRVLILGSPLISEVIVSDGSSTDNTVSEAKEAGAAVIISKNKGRAAQMNKGASVARSSILYFLHADSIPPANYANDITDSTKEGNVAGCFRLVFDYDHWFLKTQAWFTRFDVDAFRYGDQSLFVSSDAFKKCEGFNNDLIVFEDNDIIKRLKRIGSFKILPARVLTSARKYLANGVFKTQFVFYLLFICYKLKFSQRTLLKIFKATLIQDKL